MKKITWTKTLTAALIATTLGAALLPRLVNAETQAKGTEKAGPPVISTVPETGDEILADLGTMYAVQSSEHPTPAPLVFKNQEGTLTVLLVDSMINPKKRAHNTLYLVGKTFPNLVRMNIYCLPFWAPSAKKNASRFQAEIGGEVYMLNPRYSFGNSSYKQLPGLNVICRGPEDEDEVRLGDGKLVEGDRYIHDTMGDPVTVGAKALAEYTSSHPGYIPVEQPHDDDAPAKSGGSGPSSSNSQGQAGSSSSSQGWANYICRGDSPFRTQVVYASSEAQALKQFCGFNDTCRRSYNTCSRQ